MSINSTGMKPCENLPSSSPFNFIQYDDITRSNSNTSQQAKNFDQSSICIRNHSAIMIFRQNPFRKLLCRLLDAIYFGTQDLSLPTLEWLNDEIFCT